MEHEKYKQIRPEGMFTVTVERSVKQDTREKMHYEYSYTVELRHTENDFVNMFAGLVCTLGKRPGAIYAERMGIDKQQLTVTLLTLTGAGVREWCDVFVYAVAEKLLRNTNWSVEKIATAAGFGSVTIFSRFFRKQYKCTPLQWRLKTQSK